MSDPDATPLAARRRHLGRRRSRACRTGARLLQSYIEALAQAMRVPRLREQLAAHYRRARAMVAELVARSLGDGTAADDPRCRAVAALVIAACDGLAMQWMLDPDGAPTAEHLIGGLQAVLAASL